MADLLWHGAFGVEVGLEALLSPSHLLLFVSGLLVVSSPLRAAWSSAEDLSPSMRQFFPALGVDDDRHGYGRLLLHALLAVLTDAMRAEPFEFAALLPRGGGWLADELLLEGFAAILLTALILIGPTLMLLRRWRVPMGSLPLLFGTVAVLQSSLLGFDMGETILAGVVGGFTADLLAQRLQPSASTATVLRVVGLVVPVVVWLTYFGLLATFYSVGWTVEFWSGITVMSGLAGLGLAALMTLPAPTPTRSSPAAST